ncbi:NAD-dependent epimerase/dehydratase family protein, partial [Bacillus tropicus]
MKMLVTGGTGFLGQKLAFRLKNMGYEVTAMGRNKTIGKGLEQNGIEFVH